jgi:hypothetical protein
VTPTPSATSTIDIAAPPEQVYALLTNLDSLAELGEEVYAHRWIGKATSATIGAKFRGSNKNGFHRWGTTATITDAQPAGRFGFDVGFGPVPVSHWQYEITPVPGGCQVTESTWDRRPRWFTPIGRMSTGVKDRSDHNQKSIEGTLRKLKARAEAGA